MVNIILPELGEGITKATIACWHVKPGDTLQQGQDVCEAVTDKASFVIEAPVAGKLKAVCIRDGEDAAVGGVLGTIE
jgi:pyruvate/2-oxoglutarate dehydrogenase complex dihydrolipoamide acyltransferase (E2) component